MTGDVTDGVGQLELETAKDRDSAAADKRPLIYVRDDQEWEINAKASGLLVQHRDVYVRSGQLSRVVRDDGAAVQDGRQIQRPKGSPKMQPIPRSIIREHLSEVARWRNYRHSTWKPTHPPDATVAAVHERGTWPGARCIEGVIEAPVLRPDGTVLDTPGYDLATGLLYEPAGPIDVIPDEPTIEHARNSAEQLLEVVCDYPFAKAEHIAAWLAAVMLPFARWSYRGRAPLAMVDGNVAGCGKSQLADVASILATGRDMPRLAVSEEEDEMRKQLTTVISAGDALVLFDNIASSFGGPSLDRMLTGETWKDRRMSTQLDIEIPITQSWWATGNNLALAGDMARRVLHIRLLSPLEKPQERQGFRHPELKAWVREQRPRLVAQVLTLLRAWFVAGKPVSADMPAWGGFEEWGHTLRAALVWVGLADPQLTQVGLSQAADPTARGLAALLVAWKACMGLRLYTCKELLETLSDPEPGRLVKDLKSAVLEVCSSSGGNLPSSRSLGNYFRKVIDRPGPGGLRLVSQSGQGGIFGYTVLKPGEQAD